MSIEDILVHIDAELKRLQLARNLLTGAPLLAKRRSRKRSRAGTPPRKAKQTAADLKPEPYIPSVIRYPARVPRNRATRGRRIFPANEIAKGPTALSSSVPTGPVVVSARQAIEAQSRRVQLQVTPSVKLGNPPTGERTLSSLIAKLGSSPPTLQDSK
jgi:hypothetical protein